ncbi:MAG: nucleotidyltransferase family protein [Gemmatimonadetes bacterium]|nr:nucleotidyltransferase family protein [Gemmatimonadota bacterium]MYI45176.1 nucleotidyltransferase family protein [Gemmatimonadota bacterium]
MGRNKLLLELNGETVVRRAARTAIAAGLDPVIVVTGHAREVVEGELHGLRCRSVFNSEHAHGTHTSVAAGIGAVEPTACAAAIVMLADMPLVTPPMLGALVERYRESGAPLVASRYGGDINAPPILYDRRLFGELREMDARCGRQIVRRHRQEAVEMVWPSEAGRDLDRPEDYEWIREMLARRARATTVPMPVTPTPSSASGTDG